jgi:outer membrane protein with beta-barrel domain
MQKVSFVLGYLSMKIKITFYIIISIVFSSKLYAQERVSTVGIQVKPIIPVQFFDAGKQELTQNNIQFINQPKMGLSFGMVIRKGFTKALSVETGINFLNRNYDLTINDPNNSFSGTSSFRIVTYEIPVQGLVYVRIGRMMFMNVSGGFSFDLYPTPLFTYGDYFTNALNRNNWAQISLIANIGWEYRTEKSGYIYFGASLHRPFSAIMREFVIYNGYSRNEEITFDLTGNYLTLDIRYFFHEDKEKKKKKVKKEPKYKKFVDPRK